VKRSVCLPIAFALVSAGCSEKSPQPQAGSEGGAGALLQPSVSLQEGEDRFGAGQVTSGPSRTRLDAGAHASLEAEAALRSWMNFYDAGVKALQEGDLVAAQERLMLALVAAEKRGAENIELASTLEALGKLFLALDMWNEAESHLARALAMREKLQGASHRDVAAVLPVLAVARHGVGDFAGAEALYARAVRLAEEWPGPDGAALAKALADVAAFHVTNGDYSRAEPYLVRAQGAVSRDARSVEVGYVLGEVADLWLDIGCPAEALASAERCVRALETALAAGDPAIARAAVRLGHVCFALARYADAEREYRRAASIDEKAAGSNPLALVDDLCLVAEVRSHLADHAGAAALYQRALAVASRALGDEHMRLVEILEPLAEALASAGRADEAQSAEERAIMIRAAASARNKARSGVRQ
jgi:tetratricopeptide (TPR) repeat protein